MKIVCFLALWVAVPAFSQPGRLQTAVHIGVNYNLVRLQDEDRDGGLGGGISHAYGIPEGRPGATIAFVLGNFMQQTLGWRVGTVLTWNRAAVAHSTYTYGFNLYPYKRNNVSNRYDFLAVQVPFDLIFFPGSRKRYYGMVSVRTEIVALNRSRWDYLETRWRAPNPLNPNLLALEYENRPQSKDVSIEPAAAAPGIGIGTWFGSPDARTVCMELRYFYGLIPFTQYPTLSRQTIELTAGWLWPSRKSNSTKRRP